MNDDALSCDCDSGCSRCSAGHLRCSACPRLATHFEGAEPACDVCPSQSDEVWWAQMVLRRRARGIAPSLFLAIHNAVARAAAQGANGRSANSDDRRASRPVPSVLTARGDGASPSARAP